MAKPLGDKMPEERKKAFKKLNIDPNDRISFLLMVGV